MRMLESVRNSLNIFPHSFINRNNEIILIPRFNVYILLDDVETDDDFKAELCEWFSRECCCALRYSQNKRLNQYYENNIDAFNQICETNFKISDMEVIYQILGNGIRHELTKEFIGSGFNLSILKGGEQK